MGNYKKFRKFNIQNVRLENQLNKYITVAPLHQSYALCIEYMKYWFLNKFDKDLFNWIHMDGSNVFGEIMKYNKEDIAIHSETQRPELTIIPAIDDDYDRDHLDQNLFGLNQFVNNTKIDKAFIQDKLHHKYLMMKMDMTLMTFTYRVQVPSRAMQLDLQKYIKLAFRTNLSETKDADLDYLIPYPLIITMANDLGFEVKDDRVVDPVKFLTYLNSVSYIPITYKRNSVTAREEYFVRVDHLPIRILTKDVTKDDGNRYGHLYDNFSIEMQAEVRFPAMQLYVYYTKDELDKINIGSEAYNIDNTLMMSLHYYDDPPAVNDKGWSIFINTQWQEDKVGKIEIDISELLAGELTELIDKQNKRFISPSTFIDIQVYNGGEKIDAEIDWTEMKIYAEGTRLVSTLAIYLDKNFINTARIESYGSNSGSVLPSDPKRVY